MFKHVILTSIYKSPYPSLFFFIHSYQTLAYTVEKLPSVKNHQHELQIIANDAQLHLVVHTSSFDQWKSTSSPRHRNRMPTITLVEVVESYFLLNKPNSTAFQRDALTFVLGYTGKNRSLIATGPTHTQSQEQSISPG